MKKITDLDIKGKKVIIRCDFNVPIEKGKIIDDTRIRESLKTIKYCINKKGKVILLSHLGRIKEEKDKKDKTLKPVAKRLGNLLNKKVNFINETRGEKVEEAIESLKEGEILLLENTRFEDLNDKAESHNSEELGKYWASLGDLFINDAFGTVHRAHASNVGIASNLPSAVGFLIEKELSALSSVKRPEKPFIIVLGGSKVSDKIGVIEKLVTKADYILIGGGMCFTFLKCEGYDIGNSIFDKDSIDFCNKILGKYQKKIILPIDFRTTKEYSNKAPSRVKVLGDLEEDDMSLDIGPATTELFENYLKEAKTVLWNGPLGVYEFSKYKKGTKNILKFLVDNDIKVILGGGDIVAAAEEASLKNKVFHASTGGGATLKYLEGAELPGIDIIK